MTAFDFSTATASTPSLISVGTLAIGLLSVSEPRKSAAGNAYLDLCASLVSGPYQGRRVYGRLMLTEANGTQVSKVGFLQVKSILEFRGLRVEDDAAAFKFASTEDVSSALNGHPVGLRVGVRRDDPTRNEISHLLSPVAASGTKALYDQLVRQLEAERAASGESQVEPPAQIEEPEKAPAFDASAVTAEEAGAIPF